MRASQRAFIAAGAFWLLVALVPGAASGFGTVNMLQQRAEHERITRLALECRAGQPHDGSCFEPASLNNLAGTSGSLRRTEGTFEVLGTFGAVGSPDDIPLHLSGGPFYWHCDDADYLQTGKYPQKREVATDALNRCRRFARA